MLHRIDGDRSVQLPRNGQIHKVDVVTLAELLVALLAAEFIQGTGSAELLEDALGPLHAFRHQVA